MLTVRDLTVHFRSPRRFLRSREPVRAVEGVSFVLAPGETLGLVGESGCGKTTLARSLVRLVQPTRGQVMLDDRDITHLREREFRPLRRQLQMIFQDPHGSLNPRRTAGESVREALEIHRLGKDRLERQQMVMGLLELVGLEKGHAQRYPHQLSGGQRQRIGIARALAVRPRLLICDEPVSALDVSVQAQVINLLKDLQEEKGVAYLFISHDLAVVENISHRVMVMYLGQVMELGETNDVTRMPRHPYTQALIAAVPKVNLNPGPRRPLPSAETTSPQHPARGCPFHPRCPLAESRCRIDPPMLREIHPNHWTACHLAK